MSKYVNSGNSYKIYDESIKTFDKLPVGYYKLSFNKMTGFSLEVTNEIVINEKVYGCHEEKVNMIMNSFSLFNRNLGVILSGDKGIGKSISAKMLAIAAVARNIPVIICNEYIPGIAQYLGDIEQEVLVLFDEFDKTFGCCSDDCNRDSAANPQTEMLTLFDGLTPGKKLFVVTCNKLGNLSEFLVNRPGRFHYHLRFDYPTSMEIQEYLQDKIDEKYWNQIPDVISFAGRVDINYDCLRAIAFELQLGKPFNVAVKDLNIINYDNYDEYTATLMFADGTKITRKRVSIDFFASYDDDFELRFDDDEGNVYWVSFDPTENYYDTEHYATVVKGENVKVETTRSKDGDEIENVKDIKCIVFKRRATKGIHYTL